jgi:hypothetical protein
VPAAPAKLGEVEAEPDARGHLTAGGKRDEEVAPRQPVALGDTERRRHDLGRDVRERGPVHVAHGHCGDEVRIEQGRAGEREPVAADDAALVRLRERGGERLDLSRLFTLVTGYGARKRVEQQVLAVLAGLRGDPFVVESGRKAGENLRGIIRHRALLEDGERAVCPTAARVASNVKAFDRTAQLRLPG